MQGSPNTTTGTTSNGDRQRQTAQQNQPSSTTNQNIPIGPTPTTTALQCTTAKVPVLLQTARVHVFNPANPVMSMGVRLIFDSGSQRSYVTDKIKQLLSLDRQCVKTMLIKTFGSDKGSKQLCDVVLLGLNLRNGGTIRLPFLSVPLICEPPSDQPITHAMEN